MFFALKLRIRKNLGQNIIDEKFDMRVLIFRLNIFFRLFQMALKLLDFLSMLRLPRIGPEPRDPEVICRCPKT